MLLFIKLCCYFQGTWRQFQKSQFLETRICEIKTILRDNSLLQEWIMLGR